jgi:hypothetical protein
MPQKPKPIDPGHRIDPSHNGDGHAVHPPVRDDHGHAMNQKPLQDAHGRTVAPGRDRVGRIDQGDFHRDIHGVQDHWNNRDHDYHWHEMNGWRVCHHYDEFGYHWWGFYIGEVYFWTRFYNDGYWWFDPYWHRWVWLRDGQWWWQDPSGMVYLYTGGSYYQYGQGSGGVVMTPDPTPPVDVPPGDPATPANQTSVYSLDGTRSVQITGDTKDAYLYDLTAEPDSAAAQPKYLASSVTNAAFVDAADGTVSQIILTATDDSGATVTLAFGKDGVSSDASQSFAPASFTPTSGADAAQTLQRKMAASPALRALKSGVSW